MASARVLHQPSVAVQVFQIYAGICASHGSQGSCRVEGCGGKVSGSVQSQITDLRELNSFRRPEIL